MKTTILLAATSILTIVGTHAENLQSAKITTLTNDVRLYQSQKFGRQAKVGDRISGHTSVQTGRRSRTELTFQDKTITRLGANSTFSFRRGSRDINLNRGSILLQVPKSAGGATIRTATVTAAITGTTLMMEYNVGEWVKLITLEGNVSLTIDGLALGAATDLSVSPRELERNEYSAHLGYSYQITDRLKAVLYCNFTYYDYDTDGRNDENHVLGAELYWQLSHSTRLQASFTYVENNSNLAQGFADYDSLQGGLGIGFTTSF